MALLDVHSSLYFPSSLETSSVSATGCNVVGGSQSHRTNNNMKMNRIPILTIQDQQAWPFTSDAAGPGKERVRRTEKIKSGC